MIDFLGVPELLPGNEHLFVKSVDLLLKGVKTFFHAVVAVFHPGQDRGDVLQFVQNQIVFLKTIKIDIVKRQRVAFFVPANSRWILEEFQEILGRLGLEFVLVRLGQDAVAHSGHNFPPLGFHVFFAHEEQSPVLSLQEKLFLIFRSQVFGCILKYLGQGLSEVALHVLVLKIIDSSPISGKFGGITGQLIPSLARGIIQVHGNSFRFVSGFPRSIEIDPSADCRSYREKEKRHSQEPQHFGSSTQSLNPVLNLIFSLLQIHHDLCRKGLTDVLKILSKFPQFILFGQVGFEIFAACNLKLLHLRQPVLEIGNHAFQLPFRFGFIGQFLGPFLILVVDVDVIRIQLSFKTMFLSQVKKLPDQSQGSLPIVGRAEGSQFDQNFFQTQFCVPPLNPDPNRKGVFPLVALWRDDPIGFFDFKDKIEKLGFPARLYQGVQLPDFVFLNLDAELPEVPLRRCVIGVGLENHLEDFEGLFLVTAASGRPILPKKRTVFRDLLVIETIQQIDVLVRPIGSDVQTFLVANGTPFAIVGKGEFLHQGQHIRRLLRKLAGGKVLA